MSLQVTLLFHETPADFAARTTADAAAQGAYWGAWRAYMGAMQEAAVIRGGNALLPAEAAVIVRQRDGAPQVLDGPYAETKEQLGGYIVIEVADMEAAIAWASRCPAATLGAVEIRPVLPMNG